MDEYTLGVIKAEVGGSNTNVTFWYTEAVKAVAIAARNYVWTHGTEQTNGSLIIGSTTAVQGCFPEKNIGGQAEEDRYQMIVNDTSGRYMTHPEGQGALQVVSALHSTGHGPNAGTNYTVDAGTGYLKSVYDPAIGTIIGPQGHGWGLAQIGANRWAMGEDNLGNQFPQLNYLQILTHYYTRVHVRNANTSTQLTPTARWVPLIADWNTDPNIVSLKPPAMVATQSYLLRISLQNSGAAAWPGPGITELTYQWVRGQQVLNGTSATNVSLQPGVDVSVNLTVQPPPIQSPADEGDYTLRLDLRDDPNGFFNNREAGRP